MQGGNACLLSGASLNMPAMLLSIVVLALLPALAVFLLARPLLLLKRAQLGDSSCAGMVLLGNMRSACAEI